MKKIFLATFILLISYPFSALGETYDYKDGYLDSNTDYSLRSINGMSNLNLIFDNDLTTFGQSSMSSGGLEISMIFPNTVDLNAVYIAASHYVTVYTYNVAGGRIASTGAINGYAPINANGVYRIEFIAHQASRASFYEVEIFAKEALFPEPVSNLTETHDHKSVSLKWTNPKREDLESIVVKKGGSIIDTLTGGESSYKVNSLSAESNYNFEVSAKYSNGDISESRSINVKTNAAPTVPPDVTNLKAIAMHDRVDLSWKLPQAENLKHVNIYRDTIKETALIDKLLGVQTVHAAETKIFETNGTYFNDLTVSPKTTYEYTLTTTSTELAESEGVTKQVTTAEKPKTPIGGGGYEEDKETGDFTYTWTSPTKGKVKVMVGGVLYRTVEASDLKIVIPSASMKFNILGAPDVYLIPVDEDGTEGVPTKPPSSGGIGGTDIPFSPNDLLKSGMGLLWIVGPFVLLALSFLLVPKLRNMIVQAFNQRKGQPTTTGRRFNS